MKETVIKEVTVPAAVQAEITGNAIVLKGAGGTLQRDFAHHKISLQKKEDKIILKSDKATKRDRKMIGTIAAHIRNMIAGLQEPFVYKLQICSVHFPMTVTLSPAKDEVIIKNFLGESNARKAPVLKNVEVKIQQDIVTVTSSDREAAGHTAANIETATKIRNRDRRIFQDGIFMTEKAGEKM